MPDDATALRDLCALGLAEPPAPDAVGVMAELATALAQAGIWLIAIGTHDTDYVLVRAADADRVLALFP